METITIKIPTDTAYELLSLVQSSKYTGNEDWDAHMKIVEKKITEKL